MSMKRTLGKSGIEVSAMGFGCWAIGGVFWAGETPVGWGEVDDAESIRALHTAFDHGVTFYDTADVYGAGHSERVLGQAFAGKRDQIVIATKFGNIFDEETKQITGSSAAPEHVEEACDASLRRLKTDYIDLLQFHLNGHDLVEGAAVRDACQRLVEKGKIRAYGWSTDFVNGAEVFAEGRGNTSVQFQTNVLDVNDAMIAFCESHNLAAILRGPLAMGLLTGKYKADSELGVDDVRGKNSPEWMQYFTDGKPNPVWFSKMEAIRDVLTQDGRTLVQGALGWLWARSEVMIPIPGIRTVKQAEENARAMEYGALNADQMAEIDRILERDTVRG
jgi:aryl-alcohol dehydrogenase-like predicted oxidoreductase